MKRYYLILSLSFFFNIAEPTRGEAQLLASPVFDVLNNSIGFVHKWVAEASEVIRRQILPWKERISKVQSFFKDANTVINGVILNLRMTKDLIEAENNINDLFLRTMERIEASESVTEKWKHRWILGQLYWESRNVFGVFDVAKTEEQSVMDDEGRILIIQNALQKARTIYRSMKVAVRRTNLEVITLKRYEKEAEVFKKLFKE